jgi:hypothetical protein
LHLQNAARQNNKTKKVREEQMPIKILAKLEEYQQTTTT